MPSCDLHFSFLNIAESLGAVLRNRNSEGAASRAKCTYRWDLKLGVLKLKLETKSMGSIASIDSRNHNFRQSLIFSQNSKDTG